jgi:hypothetical protein
MKTPLDEIEAKLQAFIERSTEILPWNSRQGMLATRLVEALQNALEEEPDGSLTAPSVFTLFMSAENHEYWSTHQGAFDSLAISLQGAAREYGISFLYPPAIRLAVSPNLLSDELFISAENPRNQTGSTASLPSLPESNPDGNTDSRPTNAFLIYDSRIYPLRQTVFNLGRKLDNHLTIEDPRVSRSHAQLRTIRGHYFIFDLKSTGGTYVNGVRITQQTLHPGDVISLAGVPIVYGEESSPNLGDTTSLPSNPPHQPGDSH